MLKLKITLVIIAILTLALYVNAGSRKVFHGDFYSNGSLGSDGNSTGFYNNGTQSIGFLTNSTGDKVYYYLETIAGFSFSNSTL